jgi:hypothetical protein
MYAWIWRHLPFGLPGKIAGSVLLVSLVVAGLWFWGFPAADPGRRVRRVPGGRAIPRRARRDRT